jgi:hypothetical protein
MRVPLILCSITAYICGNWLAQLAPPSDNEKPLPRQRRRLHRPLIAINTAGVLVRLPANAIVMGLGATNDGFCEVLHDGRVLKMLATELQEGSTECKSRSPE